MSGIPPVLGNPPAGNGRNPDPQGGRVHNLSVKVNIFEADALSKDKKRMERELKRSVRDSEYYRARLLNGGPALNPDYPPPPVDIRREKRGSVPRSRRRAVEVTTDPERNPDRLAVSSDTETPTP